MFMRLHCLTGGWLECVSNLLSPKTIRERLSYHQVSNSTGAFVLQHLGSEDVVGPR